MQAKSSGKKKFYLGIMQFAWAELKTMNMAKVKGLYKILVGYLSMHYFHQKKKITYRPRTPKRDIVTTHRASH